MLPREETSSSMKPVVVLWANRYKPLNFAPGVKLLTLEQKYLVPVVVAKDGDAEAEADSGNPNKIQNLS